MRVVVLQEDLLKAVSIVTRFVAARAQLPVLANILLATDKSGLKLVATNLEMGVSMRIGAKTESDGGLTIPAKIFLDLVSNLPAGQITLEERKTQLEVRTKSFRSTISGISQSEFPPVPDSAEKTDFQLPQAIIRVINSQVVYAAAIDESRPQLTGVLFTFSNNVLQVVATDGFRLSLKQIPFTFSQDFDSRLLMPARLVGEVGRLWGNTLTPVEVAVLEKEKQLLFSDGSTVLTGRFLEGEFPNYERIIPQKAEYEAYVEREDLTRAIRAVSVFAREAASVCKIRFNQEHLLITAESPQYGKQEVEVEARIKNGGIEVSFNYKYILDFLSSISGDEVLIQTEGQASPGVFKDSKDPTLLHLIMPVRIQE